MALTHDQKLAFLQNMTHLALDHTAKTPNVPDAKGGMSHDRKLAFVASMAKHGLQHFDDGGTVLGGATSGVTGGGAPNSNAGILGTINGAVGLNNNYQAGAANIQQGTNTAQLNNAYTGVQGALGNQGNLVTQTQPGVAQGLGAQSTLSGQLAAEANGQGPNPAQAALNQSTAQNVKNQGALMASQRGASANPEALARSAAEQGASTQQQAAGQAATLQAQQQIAAQQQQQNLAAQQVGQGATAVQNQNQQQQNEQNILQGANTSANNAAVGQQSNINNVNAQTSAANQNMASNTLGGILSGAGSVGSVLSAFEKGGMVGCYDEGGEVGADTPSFQATSSDTSSGPSIAATSSLPSDSTNLSHAIQSSGGGPQKAAGAAALMARGGVVPKIPKHLHPIAQIYHPQMMAEGGFMAPTPLNVGGGNMGEAVTQWQNTASPMSNGPQIATTPSLPADKTSLSNAVSSGKSSGGGGGGDNSDPNAGAANEDMAGGSDASDVGGMATMLAAKGGKVIPMNAKEKAVTKGDSLKNDKVPAMLSAGELVIDRDTMNDPGPLGQMARALAMHITKRNKSGAK